MPLRWPSHGVPESIGLHLGIPLGPPSQLVIPPTGAGFSPPTGVGIEVVGLMLVHLQGSGPAQSVAAAPDEVHVCFLYFCVLHVLRRQFNPVLQNWRTSQ